MQLKDIMTQNVEVADFDMTVQEAATKMKALDVGVLPVRAKTQWVGMLTARDIAIRAVAEGRDPKQTVVAEVMTADLVRGYEDEDVTEAACRMAVERIRRLPVLNHDNQLVGIVSLGDLAVDTTNAAFMDEVLQRFPHRPNPAANA